MVAQMSAHIDQTWNAQAIAATLAKPKRTPTGWKACCPAHEDKNPSLFIADGSDGRGVAMVCYAGCSYQNIAEALKAKGIHLNPRHDQSAIPTEHYQLGEYHSYWDYRDAHGAIIMRICRWERAGGGKEIRPLVFIDGQWEWKHHASPRPLFNLDRLAANPDLPVVLVEGEKAALAAQKLYPGFIATTWPGGAQAVGQVDWTTLKGRNVFTVPDCDTPGRKAMEWVGKQLTSTGAHVRLIDPTALAANLPEGWDLADALAEGRDVSRWLDEAKPPAPVTYPLIWFGDMTEPTHYEQVVDDLLVENSFFVIYGESNSGKTFFIMDLALSVCQGIPWRGRGTRKGLVIYVAGEGASSVQNRVVAYRKARPFVSGSSPFAILPTSVDFLSIESIAKLTATIQQAKEEAGEQPALVIIDTLARAMAGGEENSTQDMGVVVASADAIRAATGACVGFVHHSGKDASKGARGSSALRAATDTEILVEGVEGPRTVSIMKQRDLDLGEKMAFGLEVVEIGMNPKNGKSITSCIVNHMDQTAAPVFKPELRGKNQKMLIAALRARVASLGKKPWTLHEMRGAARELGMSKSTAQSTVDAVANSPFMTPSVGGYLFTDGDG
jgi:AAA domain